MPKRKIKVEYDKEIGRRVKRAREMIGMTQKQLGEKLNYSESMISQMEQGNRAVQSSIASFLAAKSGLSMEYLLHMTDFETKEKEIADIMSKKEFYDTWFDSFFNMIALELDYSVIVEENRHILQHDDKHGAVIPKSEVDAFKNEIREYALFRLERSIQRHSINYYKEFVSKEKEDDHETA